jgi:hypothetical protein
VTYLKCNFKKCYRLYYNRLYHLSFINSFNKHNLGAGKYSGQKNTQNLHSFNVRHILYEREREREREKEGEY